MSTHGTDTRAAGVLRPVEVPAPHGVLEGLLLHQAAPPFAALVCHPHPLYGGTLQDVRAWRVAAALAHAGASVLRFNFRGVGSSTGAWDEGQGELEDARAALEHLSGAVPGVPLWLAGFSFGAWVGARLAAQEPRVERLLCVGTPVRLFEHAAFAQVRQPTALVQGEVDGYGSPDEVAAQAARLQGPWRLLVVPDTDHLATGRLAALEGALDEAVAWLLGTPAGAAPAGG